MPRLLIVYLLTGLLVLAAITLPIAYYVEPSSLSPIENIPAKIFLMVLCDLIMVIILLQAGFYLFYPTALRNAISGVRLCKTLALLGVASPFGIFGLQTFILEPGRLNVSFHEAGLAAALSLAVSLLAMYFFSQRYTELCQPHNRIWARESPHS